MWLFDEPDSLLQATLGNDLVLEGEHFPVEGPDPDDGAVSIDVGSFYRCFHDIEANGGEDAEWVNVFTLLIDFMAPSIGQWHCLYQTNIDNANDGECFIDPSGRIVWPNGHSPACGSGLYFVRLKTARCERTRRVLLLGR